MRFKSFIDIEVWQKAHSLTLEVYCATREFPTFEQFGLISQLRRSASSICANIAEGYKKSNSEFYRYLNISQGSLEEAKYFLVLSKDLKYLPESKFNGFFEKSNEIGRMLCGLMNSVSIRK